MWQHVSLCTQAYQKNYGLPSAFQKAQSEQEQYPEN